jgi:hypothetical protein
MLSRYPSFPKTNSLSLFILKRIFPTLFVMMPPARTGILNPVVLDSVADKFSASRDNSVSGEDKEIEEVGFKTKNPSPVFISTGSGRMEILCWAATQ